MTIWVVWGMFAIAVLLIGLAVVYTVRRTLDEALAKLIVTSQSVDVALAGMNDRLDTQAARVDTVYKRLNLEKVG